MWCKHEFILRDVGMIPKNKRKDLLKVEGLIFLIRGWRADDSNALLPLFGCMEASKCVDKLRNSTVQPKWKTIRRILRH